MVGIPTTFKFSPVVYPKPGFCSLNLEILLPTPISTAIDAPIPVLALSNLMSSY